MGLGVGVGKMPIHGGTSVVVVVCLLINKQGWLRGARKWVEIILFRIECRLGAPQCSYQLMRAQASRENVPQVFQIRFDTHVLSLSDVALLKPHRNLRNRMAQIEYIRLA